MEAGGLDVPERAMRAGLTALRCVAAPGIVCAVVAGVALFGAARARAIPALPPMWTAANTEAPFAANGVPLLRLDPGTINAAPQPLTVMTVDAMGQAVSGTMESLAFATDTRYQLWRPDSVLRAGTAYRATPSYGVQAILSAAPAEECAALTASG